MVRRWVLSGGMPDTADGVPSPQDGLGLWFRKVLLWVWVRDTDAVTAHAAPREQQSRFLVFPALWRLPAGAPRPALLYFPLFPPYPLFLSQLKYLKGGF